MDTDDTSQRRSPTRTTRRALLAFVVLAAAAIVASPVSADDTPVWEPALSVSKTTDLDRDGETVTVTGAGFDPAANIGSRPPANGQPAGVYVAFGKFADDWRPSEGAASSSREVIAQRWAAPAALAPVLSPTGSYVELAPDGTFTAQLPVEMADAVAGNYGVYTYPASGATNPAQELYVPMSFASEPTPTTSTTVPPPTSTTVPPTTSTTSTTVPPTTSTTVPPTTVPPTTSTTVAPTPTTPPPTMPPTTAAPTGPLQIVGGHLDWGVKASFHSYVTGGIAQGSIATTGGASTNPDGTFRFPAQPGVGEVAPDGQRVDAGFGGAVRFTGHGGQLDLQLSDIRVDVDGVTGVLVADVESTPLAPGALGATVPSSFTSLQAAEVHDDVVLATLSVAGTPGRVAATVTWPAIAASLTEAGVPAFSDFYAAGDALDPLTVVLELSSVPDVAEGRPTTDGTTGGVTGVGGGATPVGVATGTLPYTGSDSSALWWTAAALLLGGAGVAGTAAIRRRAEVRPGGDDR
ncbi:HtaA domain-containing protein [Rhabdothermincola salaria]|uniref:HtaA domain-containing protein n=1 Tax=Rhabdothermincola salaria TaxID=2903142 RepID=UPI001E2CD4EF|nr:HtaA domain-containing protein [Rhabdothermincola salaria]MCD9625073.1 HtaA domain-containing protein [Rhabdothermincola salaria]